MKKTTKRTRLATLVAFLALSVLLAVVTISGSAATETETGESVPRLEIVANNILYNERLEIYYAIEAELPEGTEVSDVRMAFWNEPQESYTKDSANIKYTRGYSEVSTIKVGDKVYEDAILIKSNGIDMKSIVDYVYAVAYVTVDGVDYYSEVSRYSVLEYATDRYYDLDNAPETDDEAVLGKREIQRRLYDKTLEYLFSVNTFEYVTVSETAEN